MANHDRVFEFNDGRESLVQGATDHRFRHACAGVEHQLLEDLSVFTLLDGLDFCTDQFDTIFFEDAQLVQRHRGV